MQAGQHGCSSPPTAHAGNRLLPAAQIAKRTCTIDAEAAVSNGWGWTAAGQPAGGVGASPVGRGASKGSQTKVQGQQAAQMKADI